MSEESVNPFALLLLGIALEPSRQTNQSLFGRLQGFLHGSSFWMFGAADQLLTELANLDAEALDVVFKSQSPRWS